MFKADGPEAYRCVGETEFVNGIAAMSASGSYGKTRIAAGIIGTVDLRIGDAAGDVLDAQIAAGGGRFRGIRRGAFWHESPDIQNHRTNPPEGLLLRDDFRAGFKHLAPRKLSFEVWCAHTQLPDAISLARAFPDTTIVLDHFGGPIGMGPYAGKQEEVFATWKTQIDELARCQNVVAKLGGLNMEVNGYGWEHRPAPPTSTELAQATRRYFEHTIERFGAEALHVRVELPGRQAELQLYGAVELVQAPEQGLLGRRARGPVLRHRRARLSAVGRLATVSDPEGLTPGTTAAPRPGLPTAISPPMATLA